MIVYVNNRSREELNEVLKGGGLSNAQKTRLTNEYTNDPTKRQYAGKNKRQVLDRMNLPFTTVNVVPATTKPKTQLTFAEYQQLYAWVSEYFIENPAARITYAFEAETMLPAILTLPVGPPNAKRYTSIAERMVAIGAVASQRVNSLAVIVDPKYRETIYNRSRAETLFGAGAFVTIEDLISIGVP